MAVNLQPLGAGFGHLKPIEVSAASVVELKAELSKTAEEFQRHKSSGATARIPTKKQTVWTKQNSGIESRAAKDEIAQRKSTRTWEESQETLAKGAKLYDQLQRGEIEMTEEMEENILVDFHRKRHENLVPERDSDAIGSAESDDPWVEYKDEFGRTRTCRKSEIPPEIIEMQKRKEEGGVKGFVKGSDDNGSDDDSPYKRPKTLVEHYDATDEIRNRGVGFFQFSRDEAERAAQMKELNQIRDQTVEKRKKTEKERGTSKLAARREAAKRKQSVAIAIAAEDQNEGKKKVVKAEADDFLSSLHSELARDERTSAAPTPAAPNFIPPPPSYFLSQASYPQQAYPQQVYPQQVYPQQAYPQSQEQQAYTQQAYTQQAYEQQQYYYYDPSGYYYPPPGNSQS